MVKALFVCAAVLYSTAMCEHSLIQFNLHAGYEETDWIAGRITYREYLDERLKWQNRKIVSARLVVRERRWQAADTLGTLHDQWVWGQISYREYLNLRLGRPTYDSRKGDTVYFNVPVEVVQGWLEYGFARPKYEPLIAGSTLPRKDWSECLSLYWYALRACL